MAHTRLLLLNPIVGLVHGAWGAAVTEIVRPPQVMALPACLWLRIHATVLALGALSWPLALCGNHSARSRIQATSRNR